MKNRIPLLASALLLSGCQLYQPASTSSSAASTTPSPVILAIENPNNIGKAVQSGVQLGATAFLANQSNSKYAPELDAAADALIVAAQSNPALITQADIQNILLAAKVSATTANEISSYAISGLSLFETNFQTNFPALKPNYAIYLDALANGLYAATGKPASEVTLPVIPWPPASTPAATTPAPASAMIPGKDEDVLAV